MVNAYLEITSYDKANMEVELIRLGVFDIFEPIYKSWPNEKKLCAKIVKFICHAYTYGSYKIQFGADRLKEKDKLFKELDIPDKCYDYVVLLKDQNMVEVATRWLIHGDDAQFEYLITLKDAYAQMQRLALKDVKKKGGDEIDVTVKFKCIEYMADLKDKIKKAEEELQQNDPKFIEAYAEVNKTKKGGVTIGLETFLKNVI